MNLFSVLCICASVLLVLARSKSIVISVGHSFGSVAISALLLTTYERFFHLVAPDAAKILIALVFVLVALAFLRSSEIKSISISVGELCLLATSVLLGAVFVIARLAVTDASVSIFSGAGRLAYAEDNAKWLNFASNLSTNSPLNVADGTTGTLAVFLIVASAFVGLFSELILGGPNVSGIAIQTVLSAHNIMILLVPIALAPLTKKNSFAFINGRLFENTPRSKYLHILSVIFCVVLAVCAQAAISTFGHLSYEAIFLSLLAWSAYATYRGNRSLTWVVFTIVGSSVGITWLPLPLLGIAIAIFGLVVLIATRAPIEKGLKLLFVGVLAINTILITWLPLPEFTYLTAKGLPSTSIDLVIAEGGSMRPKLPELMILAIAATGIAILVTKVLRGKSYPLLAALLPAAVLIFYAAGISLYDFVLHPEGWPHYGTRKLTYGFFIICSVVLFPIAITSFESLSKKILGVGGVFLIGACALFGISNTLQVAATTPFSSAIWTYFDKPTNTINSWQDEVNPKNEVQPSFSETPIGCAQIVDGRILVNYSSQYFCTRFLISLTGLEDTSTSVMYPMQIAEPTPEITRQLRSLEDKLAGKELLVLDASNEVTGRISYRDYVELYVSSSRK